jgi:glycine cleavage system H protein
MFALARFNKLAISKFASVARVSFSNVHYAPSHEYIKVVGDIGTVGITSHAAEALGDIVYVELPAVGTEFEAGDTFGSVESVKAASDVYVPVGGVVTEVNSKLEDNPSFVNEEPLGKGWFIKLKLNATGKSELGGLLDEAAYKQFCEDDKH